MWLFLFAGCANDEFEPVVDYFSFFDFVNGVQSWEADAGNYNYELENTFELDLVHQEIHNKKVMKLTLKQLPEQSFVYLRNQIKGLKPATRYQVTFEIQQEYQFETGVNLPVAPDTIVYKAGFSNVKPESVVTENNSFTSVVLNLDISNPDVNYSTVTIKDSLYPQNYGLRTLDNFFNPLVIDTNQSGEFWFIYGSTIKDINSYSVLFDTIIIYYEEI